MATAGVLLAEGFEEIEAITVIDLLRRAEIKVEILALQNIIVEGAHKIRVKVDEIIFARGEHLYDALILPGGEPGTTNLEKSTTVKRMVLHHHESKRFLAAICAAPRIFSNLNLMEGRELTCYPKVKEKLTSGTYVEQDVVVSDKFITSRGVGTALKFALTLVNLLKGEHKAKELQEALLVP